MSLKVNKDNIFFILPESRYAVSERIDGYMEEDFTVHIKVKLFPDLLDDKQQYFFARNGMHSGMSAFKDDSGNVNVTFTYWFISPTGENVVKQIIHGLDKGEENDFNEYTMICDHHEARKIECYHNSELIGSIYYDKDEKQSYDGAFYWFGCGSGTGAMEHRAYGNFEYNLACVLNIKMNTLDLWDLVDNYESYSEIVFNDMRKINYDYKFKKNLAFFCDFKHFNRYKVWDLSFGGNYPQFFIENNIFF